MTNGHEAEADLAWLGLVGIADPPRKGLVQTIHAVHGAGVRTVMITGDQPATAGTIARELDLSGRAAIEIRDGPDLDAADEDTLTTLCDRADVFARVTPAQKLRIVRALQRAASPRKERCSPPVPWWPIFLASARVVALAGTVPFLVHETLKISAGTGEPPREPQPPSAGA
jgi:hypothetical protein